MAAAVYLAGIIHHSVEGATLIGPVVAVLLAATISFVVLIRFAALQRSIHDMAKRLGPQSVTKLA